MKELFVDYELALKLKQKGFEEECFASISKNDDFPYIPSKGGKFKSSEFFNDFTVACPLYQQVIDWLISKNIYADASFNHIYNGKYGYRYGRLTSTVTGYTPHFEGNTRYEALNKAIEEALKLI